MNSRNDRSGCAPDTLLTRLLGDLRHHDGETRMRARKRLEGLGPRAVPGLVRALGDPEYRVRWEAAKCLSAMAEPRTSKALVRALEDEESGVRWLAAEGLVRVGSACVRPLLEALLHRAGRLRLRAGARHVLHELDAPELTSVLRPVREALSRPNPAGIAIAAYRALEVLDRRPAAG